GNRVFVSFERADQRGLVGVPDPYQTVVRASNNLFAVGAEGHTFEEARRRPFVLWRRQFGPLFHIPHLHSGAAGGDESPAIRTERHAGNVEIELLEISNERARVRVPDFHALVPDVAARGDAFAVGTE